MHQAANDTLLRFKLASAALSHTAARGCAYKKDTLTQIRLQYYFTDTIMYRFLVTVCDDLLSCVIYIGDNCIMLFGVGLCCCDKLLDNFLLGLYLRIVFYHELYTIA